MERTIGRPSADIYLIDIETGARTKVKDGIDDQYLQASPGGRYLLYLQADQYWTIDTATRAAANISKAAQTSFINRESDATVKQKPAFGVAGWTKNDEAVILYDKFDAWRVAANGSSATRLTDGATEQIRHRYARLDPDEEWIDTSQPIHFGLFGIWTKRSGYARLDPGAATASRSCSKTRASPGLAKAKDAERLRLHRPGVQRSAGRHGRRAELKDARAVAKTNPFAGDYAWGKSELVEYKNERGERLQGALFYPAGYEPGRKYPMVVYMYERLSDGLHRWSSPSDREPYNPAVFTSLGYMFLQPDIVFRPREPGLSVADCVGAAVKKVITMGSVDAARIGIIGHSWGGFDTVFLATHTNLFAAGVAGAPITDLGQQLRQPPLERRHRGDRSHRDRPAADGGPALGGPAGLRPQLGGVRRQHDEDAAARRVRGQRRHRALAPGRRALQHRPARAEGRRHAGLRRRRSQQPAEAEPDRLSAPHRPMVRALSEERAGAAVDHEWRELPRSRAGAEAAEGCGRGRRSLQPEAVS